ncbi:hypothetical protein FJM51_23605, partial [Amaricoccus solimangrovi]
MTSAHTEGTQGLTASAISRTGTPINGRRPLQDSDMVLYRGFHVSVSYALGKGILQRDAGGNVVESSARPSQAPEVAGSADAEQDTAAGAETSEDDFTADDATEEAMSAITSAPSASAALDELTSSGTLSVASIGKLAADLGVSPEDASARVSQAIEGMR